MKRSSPSLRFLAAAAPPTTTTTAMSSCQSFTGGRGRGRERGRGESRGRRIYSDRATSDGGDKAQQFVTGDSHFGHVRDTNRSFRPQNNRGSFRNSPSSPSYGRMPPPPSYNRFPPPPSYNRVPPPLSYNKVPSPPSYHFNRPPQQPPLPPQQPFDENQQPPLRPQHPFNEHKQFYGPPAQRIDLNQQFRPSWHHKQQFRPRPPKDLEYRHWEYANPGPPAECERFTVLSYNILADYLAKDHWDKLYFHIPQHFLDWERRKRSILFELGLWSADIMCLQEVDRFQDIKEELELRGYSGIWKMRTGDPVDGCAIFWRNSRFKLLYEESLEFCKLGLRDNVAQICIFESLDLCKNNGTSALTSLAHGKKLVVCNVHVLFNPKRGEIKLGQIRVLLDRAHAVSKLWDDAPLILCGDFNSTPKSPLYNFIAEQKLDLSELPRDKVSGQASAEIHLLRPFNPKFGAQSTGCSDQALPASSNGTEISRNSQLDFQKLESPDKSLENGSSTDSLFRPEGSVIVSSESSISMNNSKGKNDKTIEECDFHSMDACCDEIKSSINVSPEVLEENAILLSDDAASSVGLVQDMVNDLTLQESCHKDIHCSETMSNCNNSELSSAAEFPCNSVGSSGNKEMSSLVISNKPLFPHQSNHSLQVSGESAADLLSPSAEYEKGCASTLNRLDIYGVSCESRSSNFQLDEKMESILLEELEDAKEESVHEDDSTFLSELHHGGPFPSHSHQFEELNGSVKECTSLDSKELHSLGDEISDNVPAVDLESITVEKSKYDRSAWTPVEIETATGSPDCIVMEHALKLQSVYGEVQDSSGTRDSTGEPAVTSYHRRFMGTVDYMWRSEGLQTARVLAPIPKHAMLWTKGFPTKKWGSDHIALVSELAFTQGTSGQNTEVQ